MNMDKVNEALAHLRTAETQAAQGFALARTKLKEAVGDQNADGKVDLADVRIRAENAIASGEQFASATQVRIGTIVGAWAMRDSKVLAAGLVAGYVFAKVYPVVAKFL